MKGKAAAKELAQYRQAVSTMLKGNAALLEAIADPLTVPFVTSTNTLHYQGKSYTITVKYQYDRVRSRYMVSQFIQQ